MKRRLVGYAAWLALAGCLYFFENNAGTRAVLLSSLLPLLPVVRRALFAPEEAAPPPRPAGRPVRAATLRQEDEPGDVRAYLPGDPVNRIHWKLSAKRDELLVRVPETAQTPEEAEEDAPASEPGPAARPRDRRPVLLCPAAALLSLCLLLLIPQARRGAMALANRLFDASEAVNAYAYDRFSVSPEQSTALAAVLLALATGNLLAFAALSRRRLPAFMLAAGCAVFQIHFGLPFPGWANAALFALFALKMAGRAEAGRRRLAIPAAALIVSAAVLLFWPGVDPRIEAASERVRDELGRLAQGMTGAAWEAPPGETEARRAHTQSLLPGEDEARPEREFRLETIEEAQIAMPHWVDVLRIALLLLLTVALVILPFLPFLLLNARRRRALAARQAFGAENVSEAVCAIFRQAAAWLEATGRGAGNLPYAAWPAHLPDDLPPGYADRFGRCAALFEEAAYSDHALGEAQRAQALELLEETERALMAAADWRQRLRLKYRECLWI